MLNDLIRDGIVTVGEDLTVPFNGQEGLVDEILIKVWRIVGQDDATTAFLGPVTNRAHIACLINSLKSEGLVDAFTLSNNLLPILLLPPALVGSMEATSRLQEDMSACPDLIVDSPTRRLCWKHED